MQHPGQALGVVDTKVFEAVHLLQQGPVDLKGSIVPSLLLPKVHHQLLSLADVQKEVVVLTPAIKPSTSLVKPLACQQTRSTVSAGLKYEIGASQSSHHTQIPQNSGTA